MFRSYIILANLFFQRCSTDYNLHIITGPNGSGKSIFIRQVMLLQVMAQLGCYVPAQTAIFRPADRMYARIYLEDNMEHGASTFILEVSVETHFITSVICYLQTYPLCSYDILKLKLQSNYYSYEYK